MKTKWGRDIIPVAVAASVLAIAVAVGERLGPAFTGIAAWIFGVASVILLAYAMNRADLLRDVERLIRAVRGLWPGSSSGR